MSHVNNKCFFTITFVFVFLTFLHSWSFSLVDKVGRDLVLVHLVFLSRADAVSSKFKGIYQCSANEVSKYENVCISLPNFFCEVIVISEQASKDQRGATTLQAQRCVCTRDLGSVCLRCSVQELWPF